MNLSELEYDLPADRIAQRPVEPRDAARLMVLNRASATLEDRIIADLPHLLRAGDCLVLNRTRVLPARFVARRATGGRVEGLFLRESIPGDWDVLLKGRGRLKVNDTLELAGSRWSMDLVDCMPRGAWHVRVAPRATAEDILGVVGRMPVPPYIRRSNAPDAEQDALDRERYQTVFADSPGAVAAPTAGLHFTPELLAALRSAGVQIASVTLHVGLGTFQPVEVEDLADHRMHAEWYELPAETVETLRAARKAGGRVVAVGTTSARVLETCAAEDGELRAANGWTNLLIQPPRSFRAVDALLTNFHLPRSTLLALVCALSGRDSIMAAYAEAIRRGYRFYSYGDAMLIV